MSAAIVLMAAACCTLVLPICASYTRDVWHPQSPAAAVAAHLNGVACEAFGVGLNCSVAGVQHAFETSSFDSVDPSLNLFDAWYKQNVQPALEALNEPVRNLRATMVRALTNPSAALGPDRDVAQEKETSRQRQYCESQGGSTLYCQHMNPLPWDAASMPLQSRLSCVGNTSGKFDYFSVPISTKESAIMYPPLVNQEDDDVMFIANLTRMLLPTFQDNQKRFKTVRFQRFIATDGISLIYPAVSASNVRPAYVGFNDARDLRESPTFTHSSCVRQVVFVFDASSKATYFDSQHRSEALIFRIFRLLNRYDQVQLVTTSSGSQKIVLGDGKGFVAADDRTHSALQTALGQILRAGFLNLDAGITLAQDLLRMPAAGSPSCVKKFLIALSSDAATLLPSTIERHQALDGLDDADSPMQPYFIFFSMDSEGGSDLDAKFCSNKMIYRSVPPMRAEIYRGLDALGRFHEGSGFSEVAFAVLRYCTFIIELLVANGAGPSSADDMNKVLWSSPFYDPAAAPGSLVFTTSMQIYTNGSGVVRFRGTVEVDHVFFTYPSLRDEKIGQSDSSVVAIFDKLPHFLGSRVAVALTALNAGMSFIDVTFISKLNALALPLQSQLYKITCGRRNDTFTSDVFSEFNTTRAAAALALQLQWPDINGFDPSVFVDAVMKSRTVSGYVPATSAANSSQSLFYRHADFASLVFLRNVPRFSGKMALPSSTSAASNCTSNTGACRAMTDGLLFASNASTQAGFVLSPAAFYCPTCALEAALSQTRDALFQGLHQYASGSSIVDLNADLSLLPSAIGEMNILASLKPLLAHAAVTLTDISAVSVSGMNGVSFVVNDAIDVSFKSNAISDYSAQDWFVDAALRPGVLHVSHDPESDRSDLKSFSLIVSTGVVAQPRGIPWRSGTFQVKGLAAVAHLRVKSSWLSSKLAIALLQHDPRHICMSAVGLCAILNSRGYVIASSPANRSSYKHVQTIYPLLAQALLHHQVFLQAWSRPFGFSVAPDLSVHLNRDVVGSWYLNDAAPSKFRIFLEDSLYSVNIAQLPALVCF
jgi:hypothetical protein